jgi:hypothetical protein
MIVPGDVVAQGVLSGTQLQVTQASITNAMISTVAAIEPTKLRQQYCPVFSQVSTADATVDRKVLHVVRGAGGATEFNVGAVTAATGNATITIDLKKAGVSVLTSTITLDSTTAAFVLKAGSLAAGATVLAANDVLEAHISAVNVGTGALPKGVFMQLKVREDP